MLCTTWPVIVWKNTLGLRTVRKWILRYVSNQLLISSTSTSLEVELPYFQHQNLHAIFPQSCCNPRGGHWHCDWRGKRCPGRWHRRHRSSYPGGWQHLGACWYMLIYDYTICGEKTGYMWTLCLLWLFNIHLIWCVCMSCVCVCYSVRECLCKHVSMW